jgi:uncharacterized membrane protein YcaP (DUF421 family)
MSILVHGVINKYITEDIQLHSTIDELIVKSSTVIIDNPHIINHQMNELDISIGETEDQYG